MKIRLLIWIGSLMSTILINYLFNKVIVFLEMRAMWESVYYTDFNYDG